VLLAATELDLHGSGPVPEAVLIREESGAAMTDSDSVQWLARSTNSIRKRIELERKYKMLRVAKMRLRHSQCKTLSQSPKQLITYYLWYFADVAVYLWKKEVEK